MAKPKLTIITICYNEPNIEKTCESIVNQTWQDFEWIVVDGGSTDGTLDVLKKYETRITTLISEPDGGLYNAMNKGLKIANGEWINFMNGGDCFSSNTVLNEVFADKNYKAEVLYGNCNYVSEDKIQKSVFPEKLEKPYFVRNCICHQASFIKKDLFDKFGLYLEEYKIASDLEKWLMFLSKKCKFKHIDLVVADYDLGGISMTNADEREEERFLILEKYLTKRQKSEHFYFYFSNYRIKLFGIIYCGKVKKKFNEEKYRLEIFGIPMFTITKPW